MRKTVALFAILVTIITSCKNNDIIPEKEMVDILTKVFLTDATVISTHLKRPLSKQDTIDYYAWAYVPLGYTEVQFENSITHYTNNPEILNKILDKVINEISRIETELGPKQTSQGEVSTEAIPNLWTEKGSWFLPADGIQSAVNYKIPVVGLGLYKISAEVKVFSDDESLNPRLTTFFYFDDGKEHGNRSSIKSLNYTKDGETRIVSLDNMLTNPSVTHIMGWLMDHSGQGGNWRKHSELTNISVSFTPLPATEVIEKGVRDKFKNIQKPEKTELKDK